MRPLRVGIVAGPDAGHAFPALALAERFAAAGEEPVVYTGLGWADAARRRGLVLTELPGLAAGAAADDADAGDKLSTRAARMATLLAPRLAADHVDVVVSDVITVAGGWAAELRGLPWIELSPHPLYAPSRGLPPLGSGLAPGTGVRGRLRDTLMRTATARSIRSGVRQRAHARASIGLAPVGPGPSMRFVATLPGLEVRRPDWPADAHLIGPLTWEPTDDTFAVPASGDPLVVLAPSTARTGAPGMVETCLSALGIAELGRRVRVVVSGLHPPDAAVLSAASTRIPGGVIAGCGRQDLLLPDAALMICGSGHGILAKSMLAGVPVVAVPGGGDQWELANRVQRAGAGRLVRPLTVGAVAEAVRTVLDDPRHAAAARVIAESGGDTVDPVALARRACRRSPRVGSCA